jgi:hypothetical protein
MRKKRHFIYCVVINVRKDAIAESRYTVTVQQKIIDFCP